MYFLYKIIRSLFKAIVSNAAPWQIGVATMFGILLGHLSLTSPSTVVNPAALVILVLVVALNIHLGSFLLWWGLGKLLALALTAPALAIGNALEAQAQSSAMQPLLYAMHLSHEGWLGRIVLGAALALVIGLVSMAIIAWVRRSVMPKLLARRRLAKAGTAAMSAPASFALRFVCWFLGA